MQKADIQTPSKRKENKVSKDSALKVEKPTSIRLPTTVHSKIEETMALTGMSQTGVIKESIERYHEMIIEKALNEGKERKFFVLNTENFRRFSEALDNPREPTPELRELFEKRKWKTKSKS